MRRNTQLLRQELSEALMMIVESVSDEQADALFYEWLLQNIPVKYLTPAQTENIKETLIGIRDDELGHHKLFKDLYKALTGKEIPVTQEDRFVPPANFTQGVTKALKGETEAVKKYRKIMTAMPTLKYRDEVFNVLSDELRHGVLYNYIYATILKNQ
jgi:rubrerythrin